jgi:hypothetical protein
VLIGYYSCYSGGPPAKGRAPIRIPPVKGHVTAEGPLVKATIVTGGCLLGHLH